MKFNTSEVSSSISSGDVGKDVTLFLKLYASEAEELQINYTVECRAISGSWLNGTGYYANKPQITNGVSWKYRKSKTDGTVWNTGSYAAGVTGSWSTAAGGGNWYTGSNYVGQQTFDYELPDTNINITTLFKEWISGSIPNDGMIIKFTEAEEKSTSILGRINYFSKDTHTIFVPRIIMYWNSYVGSGTGSITQIDTSEDYVVYCKNLRKSYRGNEKVKLRIGSRPKYPTRTYSTASAYTKTYRLPTGSYYAIQDVVTKAMVVDFNTVGTKLNCDSNGNYIDLDVNNLMPERYYKFIIKIEDSGDIKYVDDGLIFKVERI